LWGARALSVAPPNPLHMSLAIFLTAVVCLAASYFDIRERRIPNWLTGSVALAAIGVHSIGGIQSAALSLTVMLILAAGGTLLYARGGIGGGDVKLAIAASGMLSYPLCVPFLLYTAIGGGFLALVFIVIRGNVRTSLSRAAILTLGSFQSISSPQRATLPYAVAFALGAITLALSQSIAPFLRLNLS
jgi:prepilin peptidase CpaA